MHAHVTFASLLLLAALLSLSLPVADANCEALQAGEISGNVKHEQLSLEDGQCDAFFNAKKYVHGLGVDVTGYTATACGPDVLEVYSILGRGLPFVVKQKPPCRKAVVDLKLELKPVYPPSPRNG